MLRTTRRNLISFTNWALPGRRKTITGIPVKLVYSSFQQYQLEILERKEDQFIPTIISLSGSPEWRTDQPVSLTVASPKRFLNIPEAESVYGPIIGVHSNDGGWFPSYHNLLPRRIVYDEGYPEYLLEAIQVDTGKLIVLPWSKIVEWNDL